MTVEKEKKSAASGGSETTAEDYSNVRIKELQLGVWKLKIAFEHGFNPSKSWQNLREVLPLFLRLALEIFRISPGLFAVFIFSQICEGIEETFLLQLSNNLLQTIEAGLADGKPNTNEIMKAITSRLMWTVIVSVFHWYGERVLEQLELRVTRHYELALMQANLSIDLPTSEAPGNKQEASARQAWECLQEIISFQTSILKTASHLFLIMHVSRSAGGPLFAVLCVTQPMFSVLFNDGLWNKICFGFINNFHYQRMRALQKLVGQQFRQDIISGGLAKWISEEFRKSHEKLGSLSERHPFQQYSSNQTFSSLLSRLLGDLPMIFCAASAIMNPTKFSVSSIAILQQTSNSLRNSVTMTIHHTTRFRRSMSSIKTIYNSIAIINSMRNGNTPYPRIPEKPSSTVDPTKGMGFCLKNVVFNYAGSQNKEPALNGLSLTIKPGQLVIIVGANGSGKSTLIRILSRLYDPTSGEVLIDDLPSSHYRIDDLHEATSLLSQDSLIYPLTLAENIGLGYPEHVSNTDMISEAARQGGALEFTKKLNDGMETILEPSVETFQINLYGLHDHPLYKDMQKIKKKIDISGGEKQRVVASRSFMRFKSGKVKFVAVDEPSSALDAEGELQLFKNLLAVREGKTMVFVTHRFGHLTKHANLILCMKDGSIVESGTHAELMGMKGEYANLYDIQASAFSDSV